MSIATTARAHGYHVHLPWHSPPQRARENESVYAYEHARLLESHLLIVLATQAFDSAGRLVSDAERELIQVLFVRPRTRKLSEMLRGPGTLHSSDVAFDTVEELQEQLGKELKRLHPLLEYRKIRWPERRVPPQIARAVRMLRDHKGYSREQFASRLGLSRHYIVAIEEGELVPSLYPMRVIASDLGFQSPAALIGRDDAPATKTEYLRALAGFFTRENLGMGDYDGVVAMLENSGMPDDPPTDDAEFWALYEAYKTLNTE